MLREQRMQQILHDFFSPSYLHVDNESFQHHIPDGMETHFKIIVVSKQFKSLTRVDRHRLVQKLLASEFAQGMHALSLQLHTPEEWLQVQHQQLNSPPCHGSFGA
jgi:BolA protein